MTTLLPDLSATIAELDDHGIVWLTLNRPNAANSRNQRMREELLAIYAEVIANEDARVLVLTGAGDRAFCAGMDLKESANGESAQARAERMRAARDVEVLATLAKPTIAAVNGYALGGGCEMALACDLRVVADEARFALPELTHGLVPGGGGTQRLPRLAGPQLAYEMLYLGRSIYGQEAVTRGLAMRSVPLVQLYEVVADIAATIAAQPMAALRMAKTLVQQSQTTSLAEGMESELDALLSLMEDRDQGAISVQRNG